jgi:A/G-specific adenine glycosylase
LPGIGDATAGAICAFAFNQPVVFIETNIRSVFIHFFFHDTNNVSDSVIEPLVKDTLHTENPRQWYFALMDYGAWLKKTYTNPSRKSRHHHTQTPFLNSNRQIRGMIMQLLTEKQRVTEDFLLSKLPFEKKRICASIEQLVREKLLVQKQGLITL